MLCNQYFILLFWAVLVEDVRDPVCRWPMHCLTWTSLDGSLCAQVRMVGGQVLDMVTMTTELFFNILV